MNNLKLILAFFVCRVLFSHLTCGLADITDIIVSNMCNTSRTRVVNASYTSTQPAQWSHGGRSVTVEARKLLGLLWSRLW